MKTIMPIRQLCLQEEIKKKRVAAYARVSVDTEKLQHSFSAQVSYYYDLIRSNPNWEYAGIYTDEGITGTSTRDRKGFNQMMTDAMLGRIDVILVKSISRFARNTVDLLNSIRALKEMGVDVCFEEQRINTLSEDGEFVLTLLAAFAQEESRSISRNIQWSFAKRRKRGEPLSGSVPLGYRSDHGVFSVVPEEAVIVQRIFEQYTAGVQLHRIAAELNDSGVRTRRDHAFDHQALRRILSNEKYMGCNLIQKVYKPDAFSPKRINRGEVPRFFVENSHEAIIPRAVFEEAQQITESQRREGILGCRNVRVFTKKLVCGLCGKNYIHFQKNGYEYWRCSGTRIPGAEKCHAVTLGDEELRMQCAIAMGTNSFFDEKAFRNEVASVTVCSERREQGLPFVTLEFSFSDRSPCCIGYEPHPREKRRLTREEYDAIWTEERREKHGEMMSSLTRLAWTPERREAARKRMTEQNRKWRQDPAYVNRCILRLQAYQQKQKEQ